MKLIYEDEIVKVGLPDKAATKGHLQVSTSFSSLEEMPDDIVEHLFFTSSFSATALFELLQAQGTNIIMNEGVVDVIARIPDDGLNFLWTPTKADPAELDKVCSQIKDKTDVIGVEKVKKAPLNMDDKKILKDDKINYLIRSLRRIP